MSQRKAPVAMPAGLVQSGLRAFHRHQRCAMGPVQWTGHVLVSVAGSAHFARGQRCEVPRRGRQGNSDGVCAARGSKAQAPCARGSQCDRPTRAPPFGRNSDGDCPLGQGQQTRKAVMQQCPWSGGILYHYPTAQHNTARQNTGERGYIANHTKQQGSQPHGQTGTSTANTAAQHNRTQDTTQHSRARSNKAPHRTKQRSAPPGSPLAALADCTHGEGPILFGARGGDYNRS